MRFDLASKVAEIVSYHSSISSPSHLLHVPLYTPLRFVRGVFSLFAAACSLRYLHNLCVILDPSCLLRNLRLFFAVMHSCAYTALQGILIPLFLLCNLRHTSRYLHNLCIISDPSSSLFCATCASFLVVMHILCLCCASGTLVPLFPCSSCAICVLLLCGPAYFVFLPHWALPMLVFIIVVLHFFVDVLLFFYPSSLPRSPFFSYSSYTSANSFSNLIHLYPVYHTPSDCPGSPWDTGLYVGHCEVSSYMSSPTFPQTMVGCPGPS